MNETTPALAVLALLVLAQACTRAPRAEAGAEAMSATTPGSAPTTPADTPRLFLPGLVSTPDHDEGGLHLTPFGELYFWRRRPGEKQQIYVCRKAGAGEHTGWSAPERASFSTDRDEHAFLTRDGRVCYFGSERPIPGRPNRGNFDMNIWVTRRDSVGAPWSAPTPLPPAFNLVQSEGESWPVANVSAVTSLDDRTYYVSTTPRGDSVSRLYAYRRDARDWLLDPRRIEGPFADPRYAVGHASLTPDGRYLFFNSYGAPGGAGGEDLYVSRHRSDGTWSRAVALATVNTTDEEAGPYVSPDGQTLYFGHARLLDAATYTYDVWNIKAVPLAALDLASLFAGETIAPESGDR